MKIAGFCSGHDCSFAVLENGIPILHYELERYIRLKEPIGDSLEFMFKEYSNFSDIKYFTHCVDTWNGGIRNRYPQTFQQMQNIIKKNNGEFLEPGHHESHAANAFFSSNFDEALIVTIDGGGRDYDDKNNVMITSFTVWRGIGNKIYPIEKIPVENLNLGEMWTIATEKIFNLSAGYPKGNQAGSVMAMAVMGNPNKYLNLFNTRLDINLLSKIASISEEEKFNVAASLQKFTEDIVREIILKYLKQYPSKNLCLSGGVSLNSVMTGKMFDWFEGIIENIYVCPVPYDAGLAIGSAQWVWHQKLNMPRITWDNNATPYLGVTYDKETILEQLKNYDLSYEDTTDDIILEKLNNQKIISVFGGGSESGRRALGNRSILSDPRSPKMKDLLNDKVKHRQWYRPFAPAILRERVGDWFVRDIENPYMSFVLKFKEEKKHKVPAVVHFDGSGRFQSVTEKDNKWFYNFLKKWEEKTDIPILLNTSFNDREPIVETPNDAIKCFLGTNIDYLYFTDYKILAFRK